MRIRSTAGSTTGAAPSDPRAATGPLSPGARLACVAALVVTTSCAGGKDHVAAPAAAATSEAWAATSAAAPIPTASAEATPPAAAASAAATATAPLSAPPGKLNVVLITIDSLRADMPWSGYTGSGDPSASYPPAGIAPSITAFEKTAVSYTRAYSISSYTAMSLGGLLAGRYPSELARNGYFFERYADATLMFPELLQKAGVRTITAHAHFYFDKSGFRQGFDVYEIVPGLVVDNTTDKNITSPQHVELAKKLLSDKANTDKRFFAWFHLLDPHDEYMPHPGVGPYGKSSRAKYDAEVTFTDSYVGELLEFIDAQPWAKETAVVISSDHGEAFGEHKMHRHGFEVYEMLVRVPLMIRAPGITPHHIDVARSAIDLAPTVLDLEGVPPEPTFEGTSLVPELYGKPPEERDVVVDLPRTTDNDRRRALIHGKYKLIAYEDDAAYQLFDIEADPIEKTDLRHKEAAVFDDMLKRYKAKVATIKDVCPKFTTKLKGKKKGKRC